MARSRRFLIEFPAILGIGLLAACASPQSTPYRAADTAEGLGYLEQRIEKNRFRVTFTGNSTTTREIVENLMFYRIAELTLQEGYDYFVLSDQDTESQTLYLQRALDFGPLDPFYGCGWPRGALGMNTTAPVTNYKAQAYVLMFKGEKPASAVNAFNASEVEKNLRQTVNRAAPRPRN